METDIFIRVLAGKSVRDGSNQAGEYSTQVSKVSKKPEARGHAQLLGVHAAKQEEEKKKATTEIML